MNTKPNLYPWETYQNISDNLFAVGNVSGTGLVNLYKREGGGYVKLVTLSPRELRELADTFPQRTD